MTMGIQFLKKLERKAKQNVCTSNVVHIVKMSAMIELLL